MNQNKTNGDSDSDSASDEGSDDEEGQDLEAAASEAGANASANLSESVQNEPSEINVTNVTLVSDTSSNNSLARNMGGETPPSLPSRNQPPPLRPPVTSPVRQNSR